MESFDVISAPEEANTVSSAAETPESGQTRFGRLKFSVVTMSLGGRQNDLAIEIVKLARRIRTTILIGIDRKWLPLETVIKTE